MSTENNQQENQGKEAKQVLNNFENTIKKLTAIVQGPQNLKTTKKLPKNDAVNLVEELFKEEHEATRVQVKEELKSLLKGYVVLNTELANERKKLDGVEIAKKKQFNTEAQKLFAKIEGIDDITKDYFAAFVAAEDAVTEGPIND